MWVAQDGIYIYTIPNTRARVYWSSYYEYAKYQLLRTHIQGLEWYLQDP